MVIRAGFFPNPVEPGTPCSRSRRPLDKPGSDPGCQKEGTPTGPCNDFAADYRHCGGIAAQTWTDACTYGGFDMIPQDLASTAITQIACTYEEPEIEGK